MDVKRSTSRFALITTLSSWLLTPIVGCSTNGEPEKPATEPSISDSVTRAQKPGAVYVAFQYVQEVAGTNLELRLCDGDTAVAQLVGVQLGGLGKPVRVEASTCKTPSRASDQRLDMASVRCTANDCELTGYLIRLPSTWKLELHVSPSTSLTPPYVLSALFTQHETYD
jgi:hypothetical protein